MNKWCQKYYTLINIKIYINMYKYIEKLNVFKCIVMKHFEIKLKNWKCFNEIN